MKWNDAKKTYTNHLAQLAKQTPYELLGISPDASASAIRTAYRSMIKVYHPDAAHAFMRQYHAEVTKLLTVAIQRIKGDRPDVQ